jgi:FG-GAP-like repeat
MIRIALTSRSRKTRLGTSDPCIMLILLLLCGPALAGSESLLGPAPLAFPLDDGLFCHDMIDGDFNHDQATDLAVLCSPDDGPGEIRILLADHRGRLVPGGRFVLEAEGHDLAVGDLNGDGLLDLASANGGAHTVSVLLGDGEGGLSRAGADIPVGAQGMFAGVVDAIAIGELDGDGHPDLAVIFRGNVFVAESTITILSGDGTGRFQAIAELPEGLVPKDLAIADFDLDGDNDIAIVRAARPSSVRVYLGDGSGAFPEIHEIPYSGFGRQILARDLNSDGTPDLAISADRSLTVMLGDGAGGFAESYVMPDEETPQAGLAVADFDDDGNADIFTARGELLRGNGSGEFSETLDLIVGRGVRPVLSGQFDSDRHLDVALLRSDTVWILNGDGEGGFSQPVRRPTGGFVWDLGVGDFDGDGSADVVTLEMQPGIATENGVHVAILRGDGAGGLTEVARTSLRGERVWPYSLQVVDMNADGDPDVVVGYSPDPWAPAEEREYLLTVLEGDGAGGMWVSAEAAVGRYPVEIEAADLNSDGYLDLVSVNQRDYTVTVLFGDGGTGFLSIEEMEAPWIPGGAAIGDLNGDQIPDLVITGHEKASILFGDGAGGFSFGAMLDVGPAQAAAALVDLDNDGDLDLLVAYRYGVAIYLGDGSGGLARLDDISGNYVRKLAVADLDRDGALDLVLDGFVDVFLGDGRGAFHRESALGVQALSLAIADFDGDCRPDVAVGARLQSVAILTNQQTGFAPPVVPGVNSETARCAARAPGRP